jgi:hypothetical protein
MTTRPLPAQHQYVAGQVDAQDGFGATVRGEYRCTLTHEKDDRWVTVESSVDQR